MTLITFLSTAFTDTALPVLRKDPVLPSTALNGAGDRVLYDWKNVGTWPSQAATINVGDQFYSLADPQITGVGDGVAANISATYSSTTGRVSTGTFPGLYLEDNATDIFSDSTADYVVSFWMSIDATSSFPQYMDKGTGDLNVNTHSFVVYGGNNNTAVQWYQPAATDSNARQNVVNFPSSGITLGQMNRFGIHWTKSSGSWRIRGVLNNDTPGAYASMTHGTSADGIQILSHELRVRAEASMDFARFYVENLTVSGRTAEQVWDADWARGNGRFS